MKKYAFILLLFILPSCRNDYVDCCLIGSYLGCTGALSWFDDVEVLQENILGDVDETLTPKGFTVTIKEASEFIPKGPQKISYSIYADSRNYYITKSIGNSYIAKNSHIVVPGRDREKYLNLLKKHAQK